MKVIIYKTPAGKKPFTDWLELLKKNNPRAVAKITDKVKRVTSGHPADIKALQGHRPLMELRVDAYRVYCVIEGQKLIIFLCAGDKGSQRRDIKQAARYWDEYRSR